MKFPIEQEPDGEVMAPHHFYVGVALAVFGFMFTWPHYPVTGAGMTLVGSAILLDDVLSHAFGVPTPLNGMWDKFIYPALMKVESNESGD